MYRTERKHGKAIDLLDTTVKVKNGRLEYNLYDKRTGLSVNGLKISSWPNFPSIDSVLSPSCKYGVVTSQLYRFSRRTSSSKNFRQSALILIEKLIRFEYCSKTIIKKI